MPWLAEGVTDTDAIHDNVAAEISAIAEKAVPANADLVVIEDSAAANAKKRVQLGNLPAGGGDVPGWISYLAARQTGETPDADDDFFDDDALDAAWTTLTVSGGQVITEQYGLLSIANNGAMAANDFNAILREVTPSLGDVIETRVHSTHVIDDAANDFMFGGLVWSDGVTAGSNAAILEVHRDNAVGRWGWNVVSRDGTFTAATTGTVVKDINHPGPHIYIRYEYDASNSFKVFVSNDGVSWIEYGTQADTVTPTHVGLIWSIWDDAANDQIITYDYFRYNG